MSPVKHRVRVSTFSPNISFSSLSLAAHHSAHLTLPAFQPTSGPSLHPSTFKSSPFPTWAPNLFPSVPLIPHLSFLLPPPPLSLSLSSPLLPNHSSLCHLCVWCAGSVQLDYIALVIISPPYHYSISPWQLGDACTPVANAATPQRSFNACVQLCVSSCDDLLRNVAHNIQHLMCFAINRTSVNPV